MGTVPFQPPVINTFQVSDMLTRAARLAGALKLAGQGGSPSELTEWLDLLNDMVDGWKIEELLIICYLRQLFPVQNGKKEYSVGPGQDFDIERPEKIHGTGFVLNAGTETECEMPMDILLTYKQYQSIIAKNTTSSIPLVFYYRAALPYGIATLWPVPLNANCLVSLYTQGALQEFKTVDDDVIMPKGYREMLVYNLAWRIHQRPPYNKMGMDPTVIEMAKFYKERVKYQQITPIYIASDAAAMETGFPGRERYYDPRTWTPYY